MTPRVLTPEQRELLELIAEATFANPFLTHRYALDAAITRTSPEEALPHSPTRSSVAHALLARVEGVLRELTEVAPSSTLRFDQFEGRDEELVLYAMLFDTFLRYEPNFTSLALNQLEAGDEPLEVDFARELLTRLRAWGFDREQSVRFFGLIYQICRAYHFITTLLPGQSASMTALRARLWQNVFTDDLHLYEFYLWDRLEDFSTFFFGETGTGKGTAARALGLSGWIPFDESKRCFTRGLSDLFFPANLSQFTESLIESELFGHRKGSFTGAVKNHDGLFARCPRHGTIFLDELGEASIPVQVKLLNVLQEREFTPVGSHKPQRFHGRVIAATNRPIDELRATGQLRDDFFYRLCSDIIVMPPLRQRIQEDQAELDVLLTHIITRLTGAPMKHLVKRVMRVIEERLGPAYPWYGNVRELEQCARRVLMAGDYTPLEAQPLRSQATQMARRIDAGDLSASQLLSEYCTLLYHRLGSYEAVGEVVELDRRTVRKYVTSSTDEGP